MADAKQEKPKKSVEPYKPAAKFCSKCGARMAGHSDRFACGRCGYTEWRKVNNKKVGAVGEKEEI